MDQAGPAGVALGLAIFAGGLMWCARNGKFWKLQGFGVWVCQALAAALAVGAGFALVHTWLGSTALVKLAHFDIYGRPWLAWGLGLAALAAPIILLIALLPGWPLAVNEGILFLLLFLDPLTKWAWTEGAAGAFGGVVREIILSAGQSIAGGA